MTTSDPSMPARRALPLSILCVLLMAAILSLDLAVPLGVSMGIPYIAVVLISLWLPRKATILIALACSVLVFGVYIYQPAVPELWKALTNRFLTVFAIWTCVALGLQRKKAEERRGEAIREREKALDEVRILRGLLPICASCKKIRNDQGDWTQMESYIRDHSEAKFSHGICPECQRKLYPELFTDPSGLKPFPSSVDKHPPEG